MTQLQTHTHWADAVATLRQQGQDFVIVTVLSVTGSTPREDGSKMVIGQEASYGSIGGGHLELQATARAARMLRDTGEARHLEYFPLGPKLGQCCGGSAHLLFERFNGESFNIALFGAGHVGQALAPLLAQLPCRLHWIDSREAFAGMGESATANVAHYDPPADAVADLPPDTCYIIMTHNHQHDYEILTKALTRRDAAYIGLIGSTTKWRRFQMRLEHQGFSAEDYQAVRCPIGLSQVPGKLPVEVAVSVAGEVMSLRHQLGQARPGPSPAPAQLRALQRQEEIKQ